MPVEIYTTDDAPKPRNENNIVFSREEFAELRALVPDDQWDTVYELLPKLIEMLGDKLSEKLPPRRRWNVTKEQLDSIEKHLARIEKNNG